VFQEIDEGMAFHRQQVFSGKTIEMGKACLITRFEHVQIIPIVPLCKSGSMAMRDDRFLADKRIASGDKLNLGIHFHFTRFFFSAAREQYLLDAHKDPSQTRQRAEKRICVITGT